MPEKRSETGNWLPRGAPNIAGRRVLAAFRDALLPARCAGCNTWIPAVESPPPLSKRIGSAAPGQANGATTAAWLAAGLQRLDAMLCDRCRQHVVTVQPPLCPVCGRMFGGREGLDHRCGACIRQPRHFASARSALLYTAGFRTVVHQFKYRGKIQLAGPLGDILLATGLHFFRSGDIDLILPVPLHPKRFRQRGFNQAHRLMAKWKYIGHQLAPTMRLLVRTRATPPQTGLGKAQRRRNIHHAFSVQRPEAVRSRRILLVDDVYTTGATADECARVLMQCGAERVDVLTLARAV